MCFSFDIIRVSGGHVVVQWLEHYATNQKVAGSIPNEVIF
jgi:hypothetical protein